MKGGKGEHPSERGVRGGIQPDFILYFYRRAWGIYDGDLHLKVRNDNDEAVSAI